MLQGRCLFCRLWRNGPRFIIVVTWNFGGSQTELPRVSYELWWPRGRGLSLWALRFDSVLGALLDLADEFMKLAMDWRKEPPPGGRPRRQPRTPWQLSYRVQVGAHLCMCRSQLRKGLSVGHRRIQTLISNQKYVRDGETKLAKGQGWERSPGIVSCSRKRHRSDTNKQPIEAELHIPPRKFPTSRTIVACCWAQ